MRLQVGITGQSGFIGQHLIRLLREKKEEIEIIPFEKAFFENSDLLDSFVKKCDVIVHLAAMNRGDENRLYETNKSLATCLVASLERTNSKPRIIYSSSIQEEKNNPYGLSKKESGKIISLWAAKSQASFVSLIIPNVFGPFCKPFYNSVVATFCYQLTHNHECQVERDASIKLIYIEKLVEVIFQQIKAENVSPRIVVECDAERKVSEILAQLLRFKDEYVIKGIVPDFLTQFDVALFNTFRSYLEPNFFPVKYSVNADSRGALIELIKERTGGQVFYSVTRPGAIRGNHYHKRKIERFSVISGEAMIKLRRVGSPEVIAYQVDGTNPCYIDMPVYYTHNLANIGKTDLLTIFWTNEIFDKRDPDTYYEEV